MARTVNVYSTYSFKNKDPIIDEIRTVFQDEAGGNGAAFKHFLKEVANRSDVRVQTLNAWFYGKTRKPQNPTLEAAIRGAGFHRPLTRMSPKMRKDVWGE